MYCEINKLFLKPTLPVHPSDFLSQSIPDATLCEEVVYQSLSSLRLSSVPLERLLESLPGRRVDRKSLERLKKSCSPQQQVLQLLRLWREQNKDQDKLYGIIQGTKTICFVSFKPIQFLRLSTNVQHPVAFRCEPL